jgi:hypothetical protein
MKITEIIFKEKFRFLLTFLTLSGKENERPAHRQKMFMGLT